MSGRPSYSKILSDPAFLAIALISFIGTMGTNVLSPALPGIAEGLAVSDARVGLVLTTFKLSAMLMIPITSVLADLYGRRPVVIPSLVVFGAGGFAMGTIDSFAALLVLCGVLGVGFAGFMPLSIALIGDLYTGATGSASQGIRVGINGVGSVVFPALTGLLAGIAWTRPFVLFLAVFPIVIVAHLYIPENAREPETGRGIRRTLRSYWTAIRSEITQVDMGVLIGGGFLRDFVRLGVLTFVPLFAVRTLDASLFYAGAVLSIRGVVSIVVSPTVGVFVGWFSRKRVLVASFGIAAIGVAAIPFMPSVAWLGVAFGVYSVGDSCSSPVVKDSVTDTASETHRAGIVGALTVLKSGGQALAPVTFGAILALSTFDAVFLLAAAVAAAYGVIVAVTIRPGL